jgi:hypothetical protein
MKYSLGSFIYIGSGIQRLMGRGNLQMGVEIAEVSLKVR